MSTLTRSGRGTRSGIVPEARAAAFSKLPAGPTAHRTPAGSDPRQLPQEETQT